LLLLRKPEEYTPNAQRFVRLPAALEGLPSDQGHFPAAFLTPHRDAPGHTKVTLQWQMISDTLVPIPLVHVAPLSWLY
jgi:hypothetical protein